MKTMGKQLEEFNAYRAKMNKQLLDADNKIIKRIFSVDAQAYQEGQLDVKTKEMLGLVASMVLRCDDCVKYHLIKCFENEIKREEILEVFGIANLVGGTIVIPHTRRALEFWDELGQ
jgi:AhpD family alkylhydroperoxidase